LYLTYRSRLLPGWSWHHTSDCNDTNAGGCQGFAGPYPSAFLDKHVPDDLPGVLIRTMSKSKRPAAFEEGI